MGGPAVPFTFGRVDLTDGTTSPPDGRLPNADMGSDAATAQHLRDIFYRMGIYLSILFVFFLNKLYFP
jgi:cytochrome c peroxidase